MTALSVRERLAAAPVRGLGAAPAVAAEALQDAEVLQQLVEAASDSRAVVAIRASNALRKVHTAQPEKLTPFAGKLVRCALRCEEQRAHWNLTLVAGELPLKGRDRKLGVDLLMQAAAAPSAYLRSFALGQLVRLAAKDASLKVRVQELLAGALEDPSAALRSRARRLRPLL